MARLRLAVALLLAALLGSAISVQVQAQENFAVALKDIEQHVGDVNSMLRELSNMTTAAQAATFEETLKGKVASFLDHVKKVDGHGPELRIAFRAGGNIHPNVVMARKHYDDVNQNVYPKLSAEMVRVEQLRPSLKPFFDQIRNMHLQ